MSVMSVATLNQQLGTLRALRLAYAEHPGLNASGFDQADASIVRMILASGGTVAPVWPKTVVTPDGRSVPFVQRGTPCVDVQAEVGRLRARRDAIAAHMARGLGDRATQVRRLRELDADIARLTPSREAIRLVTGC